MFDPGPDDLPSLTRRSFFGATFGLVAGQVPSARPPEPPQVYRATVKNVGFPTDPVQYIELKFEEDAKTVTVMGKPDVPMIQFLWAAMRRRQLVSVTVAFDAKES